MAQLYKGHKHVLESDLKIIQEALEKESVSYDHRSLVKILAQNPNQYDYLFSQLKSSSEMRRGNYIKYLVPMKEHHSDDFTNYLLNLLEEPNATYDSDVLRYLEPFILNDDHVQEALVSAYRNTPNISFINIKFWPSF